jgi:hypothetical protein
VVEYVLTVGVAFIAGLATGRFWPTVALVAGLWLVGFVIVVSGEPAAKHVIDTTVALGTA